MNNFKMIFFYEIFLKKKKSKLSLTSIDCIFRSQNFNAPDKHARLRRADYCIAL